MPTRSERKALLFLGVMACLGGGVRVMRARALPPPPQSARRALDARISGASGQGGGMPARPGASRARADTDPPARPARRPRKPVEVKPQVTVVLRGPSPPVPPLDRFHRVDVDRAPAAELQRLPGIGPALAARIVAYRDSAGPFGSLARLQRVRGIGPATLKRLDTLVTFTGEPRL